MPDHISQSDPSMPRSRTVLISVVDSSGAPLPGADIAFTLDGRPAGVLLNTKGHDATLKVNDDRLEIGLKVRLLGQTQVAVVGRNQDSVRFVFNVIARHVTALPPRVRCPDGTTGSPCVTCRDGAVIWRICA